MRFSILCSLVIASILALNVLACDKSQQRAKSAQPVAQKATKKVANGANTTGAALKPAANGVAKGINKGVQGIKKGGDAVGKALGAK